VNEREGEREKEREREKTKKKKKKNLLRALALKGKHTKSVRPKSRTQARWQPLIFVVPVNNFSGY
jgi:hypothetical protein